MLSSGPDEGPDLPAPSEAFVYKGDVIGRWRLALPRGDSTLAQWSGECEVPTAYWIEDGVATIITGHSSLTSAPESEVLGWTRDGLAAVYLGEGSCGGRGEPPGIYLFTGPGEGTLLFETPKFATVEMW